MIKQVKVHKTTLFFAFRNKLKYSQKVYSRNALVHAPKAIKEMNGLSIHVIIYLLFKMKRLCENTLFGAFYIRGKKKTTLGRLAE